MSQSTAVSPVLKEACRSYRSGRYSDALVLLDSLVQPGTRDPYPLLLLALANLQLDRFGQADEVLKKISAIDPHYPPYHRLRAFLFLKAASNFENALGYYVELMGKYPGDTVLARALRRLRKADDFEKFQKSARLDEFVPVPAPPRRFFPTQVFRKKSAPGAGRRPVRRLAGGRRTGGKVLLVFFALLTAALLAAGLYMAGGPLRGLLENVGQPVGADEIDRITLDGSGFELIEKISRARRPEFYYTGTALGDDFHAAKKLLKKKKYNEALLVINKILHSNANMTVKERAAFLKRFVVNIEEREWDPVPFRAVMEKPHLYEGVSLRWSGRVANLRRKQGAATFNLLVEYRSENVFAGIADVFCEPDPGPLKNGDTVEVKAVFAGRVAGGNLYLNGREIETRNP